jgi:hypothetical protein
MSIVQLDSARKNAALCGVKIRFAARDCGCGCEVAIVDQGADSLEVKCADCGAKRGVISERTAGFIAAIIGQFGPPDTPIILRRKPEQSIP